MTTQTTDTRWRTHDDHDAHRHRLSAELAAELATIRNGQRSDPAAIDSAW